MIRSMLALALFTTACGQRAADPAAPSNTAPTTSAGEPDCCCLLPDKSEALMTTGECQQKHTGDCEPAAMCSGIGPDDVEPVPPGD